MTEFDFVSCAWNCEAIKRRNDHK